MLSQSSSGATCDSCCPWPHNLGGKSRPLWRCGQLGLHSEFQGYMVRPCLKNKQNHSSSCRHTVHICNPTTQAAQQEGQEFRLLSRPCLKPPLTHPPTNSRAVWKEDMGMGAARGLTCSSLDRRREGGAGCAPHSRGGSGSGSPTLPRGCSFARGGGPALRPQSGWVSGEGAQSLPVQMREKPRSCGAGLREETLNPFLWDRAKKGSS